jgi:hypothetical protein
MPNTAPVWGQRFRTAHGGESRTIVPYPHNYAYVPIGGARVPPGQPMVERAGYPHNYAYVPISGARVPPGQPTVERAGPLFPALDTNTILC